MQNTEEQRRKKELETSTHFYSESTEFDAWKQPCDKQDDGNHLRDGQELRAKGEGVVEVFECRGITFPRSQEMRTLILWSMCFLGLSALSRGPRNFHRGPWALGAACGYHFLGQHPGYGNVS